jgi:hypothetical protein
MIALRILQPQRLIACCEIDCLVDQRGWARGPSVQRGPPLRLGLEEITTADLSFGATAPKHHRKPGIIKDQKTKPGTTKHNPVRLQNKTRPTWSLDA